jgi:hypothetical protein
MNEANESWCLVLDGPEKRKKEDDDVSYTSKASPPSNIAGPSQRRCFRADVCVETEKRCLHSTKYISHLLSWRYIKRM